MTFTTPAPKTLENNSGEKGLLQAPLADSGIRISELYSLPAKNWADPTGNSGCGDLLKTLLHLSAPNRYTKVLKVYYEYYCIRPVLSIEKAPPEGPIYIADYDKASFWDR